ncbi:MAG: response regulator transcription factor [Lewinellaceae bacterium]|nr:response regulator transcription factor [Phaeodactylibacter sp.]MCB9041039.1 response regulator transcription factor [Lewinellaceae bacterium]
MEKVKILLVEDNQRLGYMLKEYLELKGFDVDLAADGAEGLEVFRARSFGLCILDVMMPGMDGYNLAGKIKEAEPGMPLIFLTARSLKVDVLKAFNLGADDYIKKPVDEEELVARIRAVLKRAGALADRAPAAVSLGKYRYNHQNQELLFGDERKLLTPREAELLHFLCQHINQLAPRQKILNALWGKNDFFTRKSMDVFISKLRKYLSKDKNVQIQNVHGSGFILRVPPETP